MSAAPAASSRRCVFSTGNDSYAPKAIVSLLSFARRNPAFDLFYICGELTDSRRRLCADCRVQPIEIDLSGDFYEEWRYPRECYYHFKAAEIFAAMGYAFSVHVDGDTYCNRALDWSDDAFDLAGVSYDTIGELFRTIGDEPMVLECFPAASLDRPRIQSGVLVHNNTALANADYFAKAVDLFDRSVKHGVPRKGDDSLLALLLAMHPELHALVLPRACNVIDFLHPSPASLSENESMIGETVIYHFVNDKPWFTWNEPPFEAHRFFVQRWRQVLCEHLSDDDIRQYFSEELLREANASGLPR